MEEAPAARACARTSPGRRPRSSPPGSSPDRARRRRRWRRRRACSAVIVDRDLLDQSLRECAPSPSACVGRVFQSMAPNSSPPSRPTTSEARRLRTRSAMMALSSASPAAWPWRSLIALKPSRSMIHQHRRGAVALDEGDRAGELALKAAPVEHVEHESASARSSSSAIGPFGADQLLAQPRDLGAQLVRRHGIDVGRVGSVSASP